MPRGRMITIALVLGGLATMGLATWGVVDLRRRTLAEFDTDKARADWQGYQSEESARSTSPDSRVQRRLPTTSEPPALIMMRDRFPVVLGATLVSTGLFYGLLSIMLIGAFRAPTPNQGPAGSD